MKIAVFGAGVEAAPYIEAVLSEPAYTLCGVLTVPAADETVAAVLKKHKIPTFETVKEFFETESADLVIVASPVGFHKTHGMAPLVRTHVLCAAPLMGEHVYAIDLKQEAIRWNHKLGVGFGWNYTAAMLALKADIAAGKFGKPRALKGMVAPVRSASYYANNAYRGKMYDERARFHVYDGIVTDGGDDLLQNMMELSRSYMTSTVQYRLGRAHEIETFDTCFIKGVTENGCSVFYAASAASDVPSLPVFEYAYDKGTVYYDGNKEDRLYAVMADGSEVEYGALLADVSAAAQIASVIASAEDDTKPVCDADDTFHQLILSNLLFDHLEKVQPLAAEKAGDSVTVPGLGARMQSAYETETLPETL